MTLESTPLTNRTTAQHAVAGGKTSQRDLSRVLRPSSIAVVGGAWANSVVKQLLHTGYTGDIWPVNPKRQTLCGLNCFSALDELPSAPDLCFVGVNRELTIDCIKQLSEMGAGGASCFASGFLESESDVSGGAQLQQNLVEAAGDMPVLGPNCYGFINYLDNVCLWPDEHGGVAIDSGVAIIAQSSNVAISLSMQQRGMPLAYLLTAGNQAQVNIATLAFAMLEDKRVSAIGMYVEGFGDLRALEQLAAAARVAGKPIVVLKAGHSQAAQLATLSHTASLAGSAAASTALMDRLGFTQVYDLDTFLETLKLLNFTGPLRNRDITSISCSGGEASLMADCCNDLALNFPPLSEQQHNRLSACLGPMVALANPLDYHTYIWGDLAAMTECFAAACDNDTGLNILVLDVPRNDRCDPAAWECAINAIAAARKLTGKPIAVLASIAENMSEAMANRLIDIDCTPLAGMRTAMMAVEAAALAGEYHQRHSDPLPLLLLDTHQPASSPAQHNMLDEFDAKQALASCGAHTPSSALFTIDSSTHHSDQNEGNPGYPCVLKALGLAHKSEHNAVVLNIANAEQLHHEAEAMASQLGNTAQQFMIEAMCPGAVLELLVGVTRDASGVLLLTLAAGGTLTELLKDSTSLLLPTNYENVSQALSGLKLYPLFAGFRGKPKANLTAAVTEILNICAYAERNAHSVLELEVNPLLVRHQDAVVVDALIKLTPDQ